MRSPLAYHLERVPWEGFCTLTFGANWNARKSRNKIDRVFAWLREIYEFHNGSRDLSGFRWLGAEELGEMNARYHLHLLLADLRPGGLSKSDCFAMEWLWLEKYKGGFAKIRPYEPTLRGVAYTLKAVGAADLRRISSESKRDRAHHLAGAHYGTATSYAGANAFEVGKIGKAHAQGCEVMLSHGLLKWLAKRANSSERRRAKSLEFLQRRKRSDSKRDAALHTRGKTTPKG